VRPSRPRHVIALAVVGSGLLVGCIFNNTLHNAEGLYQEAEAFRLAGLDSAGRARYGEVVAKATKGYQADEDGRWADDALLLIAKAQLRLGAVPDANRALERVLEISTDSDVRGQAALYRGALAVAVGEMARGLALLDGALDHIDDPTYRAEGHLWRARASFQRGMVEQGWRDLDRVGEAHSSQVVPAGFERVAWGFVLPDLTRIHQGIQALIRTSRAQVYSDSISSLVRRFADRWGPGSAVILLDNAEDAPWSRDARDRLLMTRARLAYEAGDKVRAREDACSVGSGVGERASSARVTLARWSLAEAESVDQLAQLRTVLFPAMASEDARAVLNAIRRVELLTELGIEEEPLALVGAAEISRDVLAAPRLSATLFQAYATAVPDAPWSGKALLASREQTSDPAQRKWLDQQIEALPEDAYVRYARRGHLRPELGDLESRLQDALDQLLERVDEQLSARRQLAGVPKK
jgi:tetratricopeptide (TPR) repeat protein